MNNSELINYSRDEQQREAMVIQRTYIQNAFTDFAGVPSWGRSRIQLRVDYVDLDQSSITDIRFNREKRKHKSENGMESIEHNDSIHF